MSMSLRWSLNAAKSLGLFYRQLQDLDIYVEDADSEQLYNMLLNRAIDNDNIKIKKIIPLYGRENVVNHSQQYEENTPALFIIDGDLNLLHGDFIQGNARLFQHRAYCIENYLFCENAGAEILRDTSGKLSLEEAKSQLQWDEFVNEIQTPLTDLFVSYAILWKVSPSEKTVSRSYHRLTKQLSKAKGNVLCPQKVAVEIENINAQAIEVIGSVAFSNLSESIRENIRKLDNIMYSISGKDYLLKAYRDYLASKGATNLPFDESFKFRLARYCDTSPLHELSEAIKITATGQIFSQE